MDCGRRFIVKLRVFEGPVPGLAQHAGMNVRHIYFGNVKGSRTGRGVRWTVVDTGLQAHAQRPSKRADVCNKGGGVQGSRAGRGCD